MDKSAVVQIQESANITAVMAHLEAMGTQIPSIIAPESFRVHDLENLMEHASRYRASFKTTSIEDFASYNKQFESDGATCFVNAESMAAKTIFDLGTVDQPGHKEHAARVTLRKTAAYSALLEFDSEKLSQKQASEFIEDWSDLITIVDQNGEAMTAMAAAQSINKMTIESARKVESEVGDFGATMSAMEQVEAKASGAMPAFVTFKCVPYGELTERDFTMQVSVLTGRDTPVIVLRTTKMEAHKEAIALEFKEKIQEQLKDTIISVYIGEC